jgi:hypothetical protein
MPTQRPVRISTLELARLMYPNGRVTSGAGQDYLRKLDRVFQPDGFKAICHARDWTPDLLITSLDDSMSFNVTPAEARHVIRAELA